MPATTEITDESQGIIFLNYGDVESLDPPKLVKGDLFIKDFPTELI